MRVSRLRAAITLRRDAATPGATCAQHRVVVFDAGTNDNPAYPQILAGNLARVAATVGDRCMVVPTIHSLHPGGVDDSGKNQVVREFAAARPGTQTPDWQGAVFRHPELMQTTCARSKPGPSCGHG